MTEPRKPEPQEDALKVKLAVIRRAADLPAEYPDERIDAIRSVCAPDGTTVPQLAMFLATARKYDLDPIAREIWLANMSGRIVVVTGRDSFTKIANRQADFAGLIFGSVYEKDDFEASREGDTWNVRHVQRGFGQKRGGLVGAYAVVRRREKPDIYVARSIEEFAHLINNPKKDTWKQYKSTMLETRCIVTAYRMAYPLAGLFEQSEVLSEEEMEQASRDAAGNHAKEQTESRAEQLKQRLADARAKTEDVQDAEVLDDEPEGVEGDTLAVAGQKMREALSDAENLELDKQLAQQEGQGVEQGDAFEG